jgi:hypothetical protein
MTRTRITTDGITDAAVTDAKIAAVAAAKITGQLATSQIADAAITTAKIANDAVVTADILNASVTYAKIQNVSATDRLLGRSTTGAGVVEEIVCTAAGRALIDDADAAAQRTTLGLGTMATQATTAYLPTTGGTATGDLVSNGTVFSSRVAAVGQIALQRANGSVGSLTAVTAGEHCGQVHALAHDGTGFRQIGLILFVATAVPTSTSSPGAILLRTTPSGTTTAVTRLEIDSDGSQRSTIPGGTTLLPQFACRAWANFNGTSGVVIRASGNISSVTRSQAGIYVINFTTAMPDANYAVAQSSNDLTNGTCNAVSGLTTTSFTLATISNNTGTYKDANPAMVAVFR